MLAEEERDSSRFVPMDETARAVKSIKLIFFIQHRYNPKRGIGSSCEVK